MCLGKSNKNEKKKNCYVRSQNVYTILYLIHVY